MDFKESETVELKEIVCESIKKTIVAFANTKGGVLFVGVTDKGVPVGVENTDEAIQQLTNVIRDSIKPDVTMFIHYETVAANSKSIVKVEVQRGTERPYYLSNKGLRPEGVYLRQGTSSVSASENAIRSMIKETDGDTFESMRSLMQNLTFDAMKAEFQKRNLELGTSQFKTLGLINEDSLYTNLALVLSDQCPSIIKIAKFNGTSEENFQDRREFSSSLFTQLNEAYNYISLTNQTKSTFKDLYRIDSKDYPEVALREALLNALVHRDYSFSASTLIKIFDDRIEFVSVGGLQKGISLDDIMLGLSICRNEKLANVFYRLELIESYGTGIKKIFSSYGSKPVKPKIEVSTNAFKITLPNCNNPVLYKMDNAQSYEVNAPSSEKYVAAKNEYDPYCSGEKVVLKYIKSHKSVTRSEVESILKVSLSTANRVLVKLVESGSIRQIGRASCRERV